MDVLDATEIAYKNGYEKGIKEFAERLKEHKCHYTETEHTFDFDGVDVDEIDNLVKEMTQTEGG